MHFIHKEDHIPGAVDLRQHIAQTLLEFAPVFGTRHQGCHIQADQPLVLELGRNIAHGHPLGKSLGNGSLPYPRLPHQGGIVLILPAQNADHRINLPVPANDRLHGRRLGDQVLAELLQKFRYDRLLFSPGGGLRLPPQPFDRMGKQHIRADTENLKQLPRLGVLRSGQRHQDMDREDLPAGIAPRLPGGHPQQLPRLFRQALGQGQIRRSRAVLQLHHRARKLRLRAQAAQQQPHLARLLQQGQENMDSAHIAVPQQPRLFAGSANQIVGLGIVAHFPASFSRRFSPGGF